MPLLASISWRTSYRHEDSDLVRGFFVPALSCAVQYDRLTGYFSAEALSLAARGIDELIRNGGRMRLVVGCTLDADETDALEAGYGYRTDPAGYFASEVGRRLASIRLEPPTEDCRRALGMLAWLIANELLDVKVAVPIDPSTGRPAKAPGIYHEKVGVITDAEGSRLAFSGSINETESGWLNNRESFHVHCSWEGGRELQHVEDEVESFAKLWEGRARSVRTIEFPEAAKERLLEFMANDDRFVTPPPSVEQPEAVSPEPDPEVLSPSFTPSEIRSIVWSFIENAASLPNGVRVGEATSAVVPWPHQLRAFKRMWDAWPMRMLESSEVGLGKTTIAGLVLRQAWLSRRATRVLIMVPAAVIQQWVSELYEKFGLLVPWYDGECLRWRQVPGFVGPTERSVGRREWFQEPLVLVSSHLMRRRDRADDLLSAIDWDLVILDEAHHARRRAAGTPQEGGPNALLRLMQGLAPKTRALLLLTATPMQVHPVEVYDLLSLLGLPEEWDARTFQRYFELTAKDNPSNEDLSWLATKFRATESAFGSWNEEEIASALPETSKLSRQKILRALRAAGTMIPLKQLSVADRKIALSILQRLSPVRARMSRYTRALLRKCHDSGLITSTVARRQVRDRILEMSLSERELYDAVEEYISTTYNSAAEKEKNAVGFILTVYRRRLASSVHALKRTLLKRLEGLEDIVSDDDAPQNMLVDEALSPDEARKLAEQGLRLLEADDLKLLLKKIERVGTETKARRLVDELRGILGQAHDSAIVFTMYADTMEWLAEYLAEHMPEVPVGTFSGAGGRLRDGGGSWTTCSKEQVKLALQSKRIRLLVATDAAGESLNLQFCGLLANYDLPWNPMKVEQRIGRIDRIGQKHAQIEIINLAYRDTVEADVYMALGQRINLFEGIVGKLQPILSRLPGRLEQAAFARPEMRASIKQRFLADLELDIIEAESSAFDVDQVAADDLVMPKLPEPPLLPQNLECVLDWSHVLPVGWSVRRLDIGSYGILEPGFQEVRVTAQPQVFLEHPESIAFFSPGSPLLNRILAGFDSSLCTLASGNDGSITILLQDEKSLVVNDFRTLREALLK